MATGDSPAAPDKRSPSEGESVLAGGSAYSRAGVSFDRAARAKELIRKQARRTFNPSVVADIGFFGSLFALKGYTEPVLVSSTDGVGTKLRVAQLVGKFDTVGADLVNHCVNDIFTCGADPLFFLDYIGAGRLIPERLESLASGMAQACRALGVALVGGETAEMPGLYSGDDFDMVGFIVGVVESQNIINGSGISKGDVLIGLPSSGLHTNGYSLARSVFGVEEDPSCLGVFHSGLGKTLGEALLEPHRCYYAELKPLLSAVKGLAHITGSGIRGNLSRVLPPGVDAVVQKASWTVPPLFRLIEEKGKVPADEMYQVFNMGIGMIVVASVEDVARLTGALAGSRLIGQIVAGDQEVRLE
ncbi:MAG: phosphoribosylformylglycinamidine cyclo-ligase [Chloroflexota bacterium]